MTATRLTDSTIGVQLVDQILAPMNPSKQQDVQRLYAVCLQVASNQDFGALQKALRSCPLMHGALDHLIMEQAVVRLGLACQEVHRYAALQRRRENLYQIDICRIIMNCAIFL